MSMYQIKKWVYRLPEPPARVRTKPMRLLCVGPGRSATESLTLALQKLGFQTYHGWDGVFDNAGYMQGWTRLARKKWHGSTDGESHITAADFDELIGHVDAVLDVAAYTFAAELIAAYPDAKVVLNTRKDLDAWHKSLNNTLLAPSRSWFFWLISRFNAEIFWMWEYAYEYSFAGFMRTKGPVGVNYNALHCGKWLYREHVAMIKGLVPKERLLEWTVEDGWEPLCKFINKEVPKEPFPRVNSHEEFEKKAASVFKPRLLAAFFNMAIFIGIVVVLLGTVFYKRMS